MKKIYFKHFLVTLLLLCSTVATAHDFKSGGIFYNITSSTEKTVAVTFDGGPYSVYDDYTGDVTIPSTVAYKGNTYSVTSIGNYAFERCSGLTSIVIPGSVTSIGRAAFSVCDGLTSIEIPGSVTSIGESAFYYCDGLKSVTIGDGVTSIGRSAFDGCSGLTNITIPGSVTSIGYEAFRYCDGLTSIEIPGSVTSIGNSAFYGCSGLTSVIIGDGVTSIGDDAFDGCKGLTSIEIPVSVTSIGRAAFKLCSGLTSIEIPGSVTSIGEEAFQWCFGLKEIYVKADTPPSAYSYTFSSGTTNSATLYVPVGSKDAYAAADGWSEFYNIVEIRFDDGETTDIDEVRGENSKVKDVYDLSGRKVTNPTKGIYIVNGKKVLLK